MQHLLENSKDWVGVLPCSVLITPIPRHVDLKQVASILPRLPLRLLTPPLATLPPEFNVAGFTCVYAQFPSSEEALYVKSVLNGKFSWGHILCVKLAVIMPHPKMILGKVEEEKKKMKLEMEATIIEAEKKVEKVLDKMELEKAAMKEIARKLEQENEELDEAIDLEKAAMENMAIKHHKEKEELYEALELKKSAMEKMAVEHEKEQKEAYEKVKKAEKERDEMEASFIDAETEFRGVIGDLNFEVAEMEKMAHENENEKEEAYEKVKKAEKERDEALAEIERLKSQITTMKGPSKPLRGRGIRRGRARGLRPVTR